MNQGTCLEVVTLFGFEGQLNLVGLLGEVRGKIFGGGGFFFSRSRLSAGFIRIINASFLISFFFFFFFFPQRFSFFFLSFFFFFGCISTTTIGGKKYAWYVLVTYVHTYIVSSGR
jgi:hypothetical protein